MEIRGVNITNASITVVSNTGPTPGVDNVTGFDQMDPPLVIGNQLEDVTATFNDPIGFTINDDQATGILLLSLTQSNIDWFNANFTVPGTYTCTWGPGSTVASSLIDVILFEPENARIGFRPQQTGPATYNYPFTFSV